MVHSRAILSCSSLFCKNCVAMLPTSGSPANKHSIITQNIDTQLRSNATCNKYSIITQNIDTQLRSNATDRCNKYSIITQNLKLKSLRQKKKSINEINFKRFQTQKSAPSNVMSHQSGWISCDKKERPF